MVASWPARHPSATAPSKRASAGRSRGRIPPRPPGRRGPLRRRRPSAAGDAADARPARGDLRVAAPHLSRAARSTARTITAAVPTTSGPLAGGISGSTSYRWCSATALCSTPTRRHASTPCASAMRSPATGRRSAGRLSAPRYNPGAMLAPSAQTWRLLSAAPPREVFAIMEQMIGTTPYRYEVVGESEARIVEHRRRGLFGQVGSPQDPHPLGSLPRRGGHRGDLGRGRSQLWRRADLQGDGQGRSRARRRAPSR